MLRIIFSLLISSLAVLDASPAAAACITDWSDAAPIVHKEKLATVEALSAIAASEVPGVIVKTTLCEENGSFVYRLLVRDAHGQLLNRTVDARSPFGR
jgi:uncharacterized membrane protein YkoI